VSVSSNHRDQAAMPESVTQSHQRIGKVHRAISITTGRLLICGAFCFGFGVAGAFASFTAPMPAIVAIALSIGGFVALGCGLKRVTESELTYR
jgi:hypothetical protein